MIECLETYKPHFIYGATVIGSVIVLYLLTNLFHKWLVKQEHRKFPGEKTTPVNVIKRVFNILWLVLDLIDLIFLFVKEEKYAAIIRKQK